MKGKYLLLLFMCMVCMIIAGYVFIIGRPATPTIDPSLILAPLPTSPRSIGVMFGENEIPLSDGRASREEYEHLPHDTVRIVGDTLSTDLNDDDSTDHVMQLVGSDQPGVDSAWYIVAALKDGEGYLGTNAQEVDGPIESLSVQNGVIRYTTTHATGPSSVQYMVLMGAELSLVSSEGYVYTEGFVTYAGDEWHFTQCGAQDDARISPESRSLGALSAIYTVRSTEDQPAVFMTALAHTADTPDDYEIERILTMPKQGACNLVSNMIETPSDASSTVKVEPHSTSTT